MQVLQYPDDTCLIADGPASCQRMLEKVESWLQWTGMRAKVPKCHCLAIKASSGKRYDPRLQLCGTDIPFIGDNTISFLGGPINVPQSTSNHRKRLVEKLERLLQRVDAVLVTRKQKLLFYKAGICFRLSWDLSVTTLPLSWLKTSLEVKVTKYLKQWSGLAQPADPARLYLPKTEGGLQLPSLSLLYEKLKSSQASSLLTSHDGITCLVTTHQIQKEERMKRASFRPMGPYQRYHGSGSGGESRCTREEGKAAVDCRGQCFTPEACYEPTSAG